MFLLRTISPLVNVLPCCDDLSSVSSSPTGVAFGLTDDRMVREFKPKPLATLTVTGELNVLTNLPSSPPLTVIFWLNVTGVSNVVTRLSMISSGSSESTNVADSKNTSSPVIASILRLPMYRSPFELRPV